MTKSSPIKTTEILAVLILMLGCGSKGAVGITARIDAPQISVQPGPLVAGLSGGLTLTALLGEQAPSPRSLELGSFSVQRDQEVLVEPLKLSADLGFPLQLRPGNTRSVRLTVESGQGVNRELGDRICSGMVRIAGTLTETSGEDSPTSVLSNLFAASCP